jgi:hypothetical protein
MVRTTRWKLYAPEVPVWVGWDNVAAIEDHPAPLPIATAKVSLKPEEAPRMAEAYK